MKLFVQVVTSLVIVILFFTSQISYAQPLLRLDSASTDTAHVNSVTSLCEKTLEDAVLSDYISEEEEDGYEKNKFSVSDWSTFWGAALGALVSALVSISVFCGTIYNQKRKHDKKLGLSLAVIYKLCNQAIEYLTRFITDVKNVKEVFEEFKKTDSISSALPFKEPYAIRRLKDFDQHLFSESVVRYKVKGYPELATNLDYICHYIDYLNEYFRDKDMALRQTENTEACAEVFTSIIEYIEKEEIGVIAKLEAQKTVIQSFSCKAGKKIPSKFCDLEKKQ